MKRLNQSHMIAGLLTHTHHPSPVPAPVQMPERQIPRLHSVRRSLRLPKLLLLYLDRRDGNGDSVHAYVLCSGVKTNNISTPQLETTVL